MFDVLQWPALAATAAAVWLVASDSQPQRLGGFALGLISSGLWAAWAWHASGWALLALQVLLAFVCLRGLDRNRLRQDTRSDLELDALESIRSRRSDADFAALVREDVTPDRHRSERRRAA